MRPYLEALLDYAEGVGLILKEDRVFAFNRLLEIMELDEAEEGGYIEAPLYEILEVLCDDACRRGLIEDNGTARDLFDTKLMGALTPFPHEVRAGFASLYEISPETATSWFYRFSQDTNYIRRDRIRKDQKWVCESEYGPLDITITLAKPE